MRGLHIKHAMFSHGLEARLSENELRAVGDEGLAGFIKVSWDLVVPRPLRWNWHHDIMVRALEDITYARSRNLIIALPPSCSKSLFVSVFWPAWEWTINSNMSFIFGAYGDKLTLKCARQHRDLVNAPWYKAKWPEAFIPFQNTHAASWFENRAKGFRFSGTVGGDVTGRHGDRLVGDDLNKAQEIYGQETSVVAAFDKSWDYWDGTLMTRRADPVTTARVLAGHRLHRDDTAGRWERKDPTVEVIAIPMRYDPNHPNLHPDDPRTEEGELLWPARWPEAEVRTHEKRPSEFAAQFQQNPLPPGGLLILDSYLSHRYDNLPSDLQRTVERREAGPQEQWITSWDLTFKGKSTSDFVVGQLWCNFEGQQWLVDQVRGRMGYMKTKQTMVEFIEAHPWVRRHLVEDAANAAALVDDLCGVVPGLILEPHGGGCLARIQKTEGAWASGSVRIPQSAPWLGGSDGFIAEHLSFDGLGTRHDDQVAASGLALAYLTGRQSSRWVDAMRAAQAHQ